MGITFIITFQAKPETEKEFLALMLQVQKTLPDVEGCVGVQVFRQAEHSSIFTLVESWTDMAAHQANSRKLVASGVWDNIVAMLAVEPDGNYFKDI